MFFYLKLYRTCWVVLALIGWFSTAIVAQAPQDLSQFDRRVLSPAPQATQLGSYGNVAPDLTTGAIQLQVPLVEASSRQLRLPIGLNYHYTGLMVDELASWVGLGWTLSAGGVVTRTIRGLPDELPRGYTAMGNANIQALIPQGQAPVSQIHFQFPIGRTTSNGALWDLSHNHGAQEVDLEPDAYTLSLPGYSGKFLVNAASRPLLSPHTDIQLVGDAGGWLATTGDGTRYHFESAETTQGSDDLGALPNGQFPTAWYLSRMESADGTDTIRFEYQANPNSTVIPANTIVKAIYKMGAEITSCDANTSTNAGTDYNVTADVQGGSWPSPRNSQQTIYLSRITTATLRIDFISDLIRDDIEPTGDRVGRRLTAVTVSERYSGRLLKRVELTQGYFNNVAAPTTDRSVRRLRLDAVTEVGKPGHRFYYDESQPMPSRLNSLAKDHWGFYTGRPAPTTLIPSLPPTKSLYSGDVTGVNREANSQAAQLGTLLQVQYPTGGRTWFEYEPNVVMERCGKAATAFGRASQGASGIPPVFVTGGTPFSMDDFETDISGYILSNSSSGGGGQNRPVPTNVRATIINVPYGGYLTSLTSTIYNCTGNCTARNPQNCQYALRPMDVRFYRVDTANSPPRTYASLADGSLSGEPLVKNEEGNNSGAGCGNSPITHLESRVNRQLQPGQYCIVAVCNSSTPAGMSAALSAVVDVYRPDTTGTCFQPRQVGGLRVKRTLTYAGQGDTLTTTYSYNTAKNPAFSSGYLYYEPKYDYTNVCQHLVVGASDQSKTNWLESGYHIGYGRVTVRKSRGQVGATVHTFSTNELAISAPVPAALRGLALKTEQFTATGQLVQRDSTVYSTVLTGYTNAVRIYPNYLHRIPTFSGGGTVYRDEDLYYTVKNDVELAYWPRVARSLETTFGAPTPALAQTRNTVHHYLPWNFQQTGPVLQTTQPVLTARTDSEGREIITQTLYAGQYAQTGGDSTSTGIKTLVENGMLSVPLGQQTWVRTGRDSSLVSGQITHYFRHPPSNANSIYGRVYPQRVFQLATAAPVPATAFTPAAVQNGVFQQDPRYQKRQEWTRYDAFGNLLRQQPVSGNPTTYLWGYAASQPIAEAQNATRAQVAYTSFESDARGRWQYDAQPSRLVATHFTGRQAYQLDGTAAGAVSCPTLPAGDYELLVWGHGGTRPVVTGYTQFHYERVKITDSGWQLHRFRLSVPANGTLLVNSPQGTLLWIDELRLAPVGALLSTYTYDSGVGRTSATDPSGRTLTYEYDALGRLVRTRDEQGRIVSQQQYHYAGQ